MSTSAEPTASDLAFVDNRYGSGVRVRPEFEQYEHGGLGIRLVVDGNQGDAWDCEPWAHATVNLQTEDSSAMKRGNVALKNWSENAGLPELMVKAGIVESENRKINGVSIYMLTEKALSLANDLLDAPVPKKRGPRP